MSFSKNAFRVNLHEKKYLTKVIRLLTFYKRYVIEKSYLFKKC